MGIPIKEPMSRLSIDRWGPAAWGFLHTVTFVYPLEPTRADRVALYEYIVAFSAVIPCVECRRHFQSMVERDVTSPSSAALGSRDAASRLAVQWHNSVNARIGKPILPYERVYAMYYPSSRQRFDVVAGVVLAMLVIVGLGSTLGRKRCRKTYTIARVSRAR